MPSVSDPAAGQLSPRFMRRVVLSLALILFLCLLIIAPAAFAQGAGGPMPFATGLCGLAQLISGPIVRWTAVIAVVILGIVIAVGEVGPMFSAIAKVLIGLSVCISAVGWINYWTGATVQFAC
ncbi:MAG: TrbC/VirB2 family protein [bacterium]|jgi:type IV secretory pathway VirB2 component (pilin)